MKALRSIGAGTVSALALWVRRAVGSGFVEVTFIGGSGKLLK